MLLYFDKKTLVCLCFLASVTVAQVTAHKDKKVYFKADNAFDYGDYFNAMQMYESLYHLDSTGNELNFKLGICNYQLKKFRANSRKYFDRVSPEAYPEVNYYLGSLNHIDLNFEKAIYHFHQYLANKDDNREHTNKEIEDLIEKSHVATLFMSKPDESVVIENLGDKINTEFAEYGPLIPAEENFIIFTARRSNHVYQNKDVLGDYFEDIYVSKRIDSTWGAPTMLDTSINKSYHDAATGLSADGEKLLSYHTSPDHIHGHIYESTLANGTWTSPELVHAHVNSEEFIETSACYSPDGEIIFFSSNRPGGYGGKDLYSVKKFPNGVWAKPMNLGPTINTPYNEDAPFVHPSDNILFFSSEGHKNMGGYDVFRSKYDEVEHFTTPENLGYPLNTVDDDIFFVLNTDGSRGYFSSQRKGGKGSHDIYSAYFTENNIPLEVYTIHATDENGEIIHKVSVVLSDMTKKEVVGEYRSNSSTGKVLVISKPEKKYRMAIEANGYEHLILNSIQLGKETDLTFKLTRKKS